MANKQLIALTTTGSGKVEIDSDVLGTGGEGSVYSIVSGNVAELPPSELVAKLYHDPSEGSRATKLKAMLKSPPHNDSVAWPLAILITPDKKFVGYVMKKLASHNFRAWSELAHAAQRRETASSFDVKYAITAIYNLSAAIYSVHNAGHRIGDINESNIFVGADARVLIIDTDSAQITTPEGDVIPCMVGKPEYVAPEISHGSLRNHRRTIETDVFAFAVAAYQMLTGGAHPTDATFTGEADPSSVEERIREGVMPGLDSSSGGPNMKHPNRISTAAIPTSLQKLLKLSLSVDPNSRPSMQEWIDGLVDVSNHLSQCDKVDRHWFDSRDGRCGWCAHVDSGQPDPWSDKSSKDQNSIKQMSLPTVQFNQGNGDEPIVRRSAPARAGPQPQGNSGGLPTPTGFGQGQQFPPLPGASGYSGAQGPPQGHTQGQQGQYGQSGQQQSQGPQATKMAKGKTILERADGTQIVRPPIGALLRENPKLAIHCIKNEMPDVAKFWWPPQRKLANKNFLFVGLFLATAIGFGWVSLGRYLSEQEFTAWASQLYSISGVVAGVATVFFSICLTFSGLWDRRRARKAAGSLDNFTPETPTKTVSRFVALSFVYGPLFTVGLFVGVIFMSIKLVIAIIEGNK